MPAHITPEKLNDCLENNQATLIDVRSLREHQAQNIPHSSSIPLDTLHANQLNSESSQQVVLYCQTGQRSDKAFEILSAQAPKMNFLVLKGGLEAWKKSGYAIHQQNTFYLPLNQQVQITIGMAVLASSLLAYFYDTTFIVLAGLFGAGLTMAGITGFCGLAKLMGIMPWNKAQG